MLVRQSTAHGWVAQAKNRGYWRKFVVDVACATPPRKAKKKSSNEHWSDDIKEHGSWPSAPLGAPQASFVFTDGSAIDNGGADAAAGAGVFFAEGDARNISQPLRAEEEQTNNRGELTAIILALMAREEELARGDTVVPIGTDSQYSIRLAGREGRVMRARGWKTSRGKPAKNTDLVKILLAWMAAYGSRILFVHIFSHTGKGDPLSIGNDGADRMAVAGAKAGRGGRAGTRYIALRLPRPRGPTPPPL